MGFNNIMVPNTESSKEEVSEYSLRPKRIDDYIIFISKISDDLFTIVLKSSTEYNSNLFTIPNLSLSGVDKHLQTF